MTAYIISGHKGIEERFSGALGLGGEGRVHETEDEHGTSILGFRVEGDLLAIAALLTILLAVGALAYYKLKQ